MSEFIKIGNTSFRRSDVKGKSLSKLSEENHTIRKDVIQALFDTLQEEAQAEKDAKADAKAKADADRDAKKNSKTSDAKGSEE